MPRYVLTGGNYGFINGSLVYVGETFDLPEGVKPPRCSRLLAEGEAPPAEEPEEPEKNLALSEMKTKGGTEVRQSDVEPV